MRGRAPVGRAYSSRLGKFVPAKGRASGVSFGRTDFCTTDVAEAANGPKKAKSKKSKKRSSK